MDFSQLDPRLAAMMGQLGVIAGEQDDDERSKQYDMLAQMLADVKVEELQETGMPVTKEFEEDKPKDTQSVTETSNSSETARECTGTKHQEFNKAVPCKDNIFEANKKAPSASS